MTLSEESPEGFEILQTIRTENTDYLFIDLAIDEAAKAGVIDLVFTRGRKERRVEPYPFLERAPRERGLDPSDLIYLIMPDRFANGDASNDVVEGMQEMLVDRDSVHARHGGDIRGITNHLEKRLKAHNAGKASKYTRVRLPVEVVYSEEVEDKSAALRRECEIKQLSRQEKLKITEHF